MKILKLKAEGNNNYYVSFIKSTPGDREGWEDWLAGSGGGNCSQKANPTVFSLLAFDLLSSSSLLILTLCPLLWLRMYPVLTRNIKSHLKNA
ncbi:hypothetical protein KA005_41075 [bacterium]|nr:hypothetical protein [bacterium]